MSDKKLPATSQEVAERVDTIADVMRHGEWKRGVTGQLYADKWGISLKRVEEHAAEAWRRVCREANNPDNMRPEIAGILRKNLNKADDKGNFSAIAALADTYSKVIGARAPDRHEHAVVVAQFDQLTKSGKVQWIQERINQLEEAKRALLEDDENALEAIGTSTGVD